MRFYLVQHGDAVPKEVNPDRPLSEQGIKDVMRVASFLKKAGVRVSRILHSGKLRAEGTAELLATAIGPEVKVEAAPGLDPLYPPEGLAQKAAEWDEDTMVVGHLPFMAKLASRLLTGGKTQGAVGFTPGTVVCFERREAWEWILVWMVRPELLRGT